MPPRAALADALERHAAEVAPVAVQRLGDTPRGDARDRLTWALGVMYLAAPPENPSLLSLLGPWPWYILSAAGVAIVLFAVLDAPFRSAREREAASTRTP